MAVIRCPECSKKLKVADTSVGKKVKCSCGNIFVAETEEKAAAPLPVKKAAVAVAAEKVFVSCTNCEGKLKVATTSLGKKMKCPKCAGVFVAAIDEETPPAPAKKVRKPTPKPIADDKDDEETPKAKSKAKGKPAKEDDDEMDALFGFAQADADTGGDNGMPSFDEEEEKPKSKAVPAKKPSKAARPFKDEDGDENDESPRDKKAKIAAPVYPRRTVLNIFVLTLVTLYIAFFLVVYFDQIELGTKHVAMRPGPKNLPNKKTEEIKNEEKKTTPPLLNPWQDRYAALQKQELNWLKAMRKNPRPDVPGVLAILSSEAAMIDDIAFSPVAPILASAARDNEKEGIKLWDLKTGKETKTIPVELKSATLIRFSPDGALLAVVSNSEKFLKVWKVSDGAEVKTLTLENVAEQLAFSANGKRLLMTTAQATDVKMWEIADWKKGTFNAKTEGFIHYLLALEGDKVVAVDEMKKQLAVHDLATGVIKNVKHDKTINAVRCVISPNGRFLAYVDAEDEMESLVMCDLESGAVETLIPPKNTTFSNPRFSTDGKYISYAIKDGEWKTILLEIALKKERSVFPGESPLTFSHGDVFVARTVNQDDRASIHLMALEDLIAEKKDDDKKSDEKKKDEDKKNEEKKKDDDKKVEEKKKGEEKKVEEKKRAEEKKIVEKKKDEDKKELKKSDEKKKIEEKDLEDKKADPKKDDAKKIEEKPCGQNPTQGLTPCDLKIGRCNDPEVFPAIRPFQQELRRAWIVNPSYFCVESAIGRLPCGGGSGNSCHV